MRYTVLDKVMNRVSSGQISAYWSNGNTNFGDMLTPIILKYYGLKPVYRKLHKQPEILGVGSILGWLEAPEEYQGIILGSGCMYESDQISLPNANIWGLRGKLTQERVHNTSCFQPMLGDLGLLIPKIFTKYSRKKNYTLGIIPHFVDVDSPLLNMLVEAYPKEVTILDVFSPPHKLIEDISKCEYILSSSLHGLIAAQALGIPANWLILSDKVWGNGFKFRDYASVFDGYELEPITALDSYRLILSGVIREIRAHQISYSQVQDKIEELDEYYRRKFKILQNSDDEIINNPESWLGRPKGL